MENLKSYEKEEVPDLGQDYWMHVGRMERCKGLGLPIMLGISAGLCFLTCLGFLLASKILAAHSRSVWMYMFYHISAMGACIAVIGAIVSAAIGIILARDQRRWRREMPLEPKNYSPEMAEKAYHAVFTIGSYNKLLWQTHDNINSLRIMKGKIDSDLAFTRSYEETMSEEDIDILTLHAHEESRA